MVTLGGNIHWMPVRRLFRMSSMKALREKVKCVFDSRLRCLYSCLQHHCVQIPSPISFGYQRAVYLGGKVIYNRPKNINHGKYKMREIKVMQFKEKM
jgi:hypothetical protein